MGNKLYYGDNLEVMRHKIPNETVDLCYIDPPFNSKRDYFQIYNNIGTEDRALARAFEDTWEWGVDSRAGYSEIIQNSQGRFTRQVVELMKGLKAVLSEGALLAYLVSITLRVTEIHRVLKPTGGFYLHCDPTASHYLKLILDAIFCTQGGNFVNEIVWCYNTGGRAKSRYPKKHDVIFWYSKSEDFIFKYDDVALPRDTSTMHEPILYDSKGKAYQRNIKNGKEYKYYLDKGVLPNDWWTDLQAINPSAKERLGYPTQKPEALLERIIKAGSNEGDLVLDAYCGCGTTVAVAQRLKRRWIGIDITYQSISLILRRIEFTFDVETRNAIILDGIPQDMDSVKALIHKKDDRLRKEFEKWAVLTYSNNRAVINDKKGADKGIDGIAYFATGKDQSEPVIFQVKSGKVNRETVAKLRGDMARENINIGILITMEEPTKPMIAEALSAGVYRHELLHRDYDCIQIVTIREMIEESKRLELPLILEVVKKAEAHTEDHSEQTALTFDEA